MGADRTRESRLGATLTRFERERVLGHLEANGWKISESATAAGVSKRTLRRRMAEFKLEPPPGPRRRGRPVKRAPEFRKVAPWTWEPVGV
jgi:DNA-binding NtrC family response regulator